MRRERARQSGRVQPRDQREVKMKHWVRVLGLVICILVPAVGHADTWRQVNDSGFGDSGNLAVYALCEYGGYLYAGTSRLTGGGEIWRFNGFSWHRSGESGLGNPDNAVIRSLAVFDGRLYAGTTNNRLGTEVWQHDGRTWRQVNVNGFGDPDNISTQALETHNNRLYAATHNNRAGTEVWEYNGSSWNQVNRDGFGDPDNRQSWDLVGHAGFLYAGTTNEGGAEIRRYDGGITWTRVNTSGFGDADNRSVTALVSHTGRLYAATGNLVTGSEVWEYNGTGWTQANEDGFGSSGVQIVHGFAAFDGRVFAGTRDGGGAAALRCFEGEDWSDCAPEPFGTGFARALAVFGERLYVATDGPGGATVWEYTTASLAQINLDGFGVEENTAIADMAGFRDRLYVVTLRDRGSGSSSFELWEQQGPSWRNVTPAVFAATGGARLGVFGDRLYLAPFAAPPPAWMAVYDGTTWTIGTMAAFEDPGNLGVSAMLAHGGSLYACTINNSTGAEVWGFDGTTWSQVNSDGFGDPNNRSCTGLAAQGERLYAATWNRETGTEVWARDGSAWRQVNEDGFGRDPVLRAAGLCVYQGDLFAGASRVGLGFERLYRYDGARWTEVDLAAAGFSATEEMPAAMAAYQRNLYFSSVNLRPGAAPGAVLRAWNGAGWSRVSRIESAFRAAVIPTRMLAFQGRLYIGSGQLPVSGDGVLVGPGDSGEGGDLVIGDPFDESGVPARVWAFHDPGPAPRVRANGAGPRLAVTPGTAVSLSLGLDPLLQAGHLSDWWIGCLTPFPAPVNIISLTLAEGWVAGLRVCLQYPLVEIAPPVELFSLPLPIGDYLCYFAVDADSDGLPDADWWDAVMIQVGLTPGFGDLPPLGPAP